MVTMGILSYQGKIPMVEPGIEPGPYIYDVKISGFTRSSIYMT
jgi:hypothetical protein